MSAGVKISTAISHQYDDKKSALADYLERSGLSLWLSKDNGNTSSLPQIEVVLDEDELNPALKGMQLHDGCCGGSTCNGSC